MRSLRDAAALPLVTLQVLPAVAHNANASGFIMADDATDRDGATLSIPADAWQTFTNALK